MYEKILKMINDLYNDKSSSTTATISTIKKDALTNRHLNKITIQ